MPGWTVLEGLNPEQRRAAEAVRGPVCILAGAGSGKTTTITRRIAHQVETGAFAPGQILAVTFTEKAAGVMKSRLAALGVTGVAAADVPLRRARAAPPLLARDGRADPAVEGALAPADRERPAGRRSSSGRPRDLATEIEWAKNQRIGPNEYRSRLGDHEPPIPEDLMARVYKEYERRKAARGEIDFEDLLELAVRASRGRAREVRAAFRDRYRAFTVDEYQDVNLLQQTLLELWLGDRDDLCVVGDDYQSIYGFTGATPRWLLGVAASASRTRRSCGSRRTTARAPRCSSSRTGSCRCSAAPRRCYVPPASPGPSRSCRPFADADEEDAWIAAEVKRLAGGGTPLEEMAVLARTNARLADFEEAFHEAGIPFQGSSLLEREAARRMLKLLERDNSGGVAERVRLLAEEAGMLYTLPTSSASVS